METIPSASVAFTERSMENSRLKLSYGVTFKYTKVRLVFNPKRDPCCFIRSAQSRREEAFMNWELLLYMLALYISSISCNCELFSAVPLMSISFIADMIARVAVILKMRGTSWSTESAKLEIRSEERRVGKE